MAASTRHLAQFVGGGTQLLLPVGLASEATFEQPHVARTVAPGGIGTVEVFGVAFVGGALTVLPVGIGSEVVVGEPAITGGYFLVVSGIVSAEAFGDAATKLAVVPVGIPSDATFGSPSFRTNFYTVFWYESRAEGQLADDSLTAGRLVQG